MEKPLQAISESDDYRRIVEEKKRLAEDELRQILEIRKKEHRSGKSSAELNQDRTQQDAANAYFRNKDE